MMKTGTELIADERQRQTQEEGYSAEVDDQQDRGELATAAGTYALMHIINEIMLKANGVPHLWPWDYRTWKPCPGDRIKELTKAGALIAAEIDRLQRSNELRP